MKYKSQNNEPRTWRFSLYQLVGTEIRCKLAVYDLSIFAWVHSIYFPTTRLYFTANV